MKIEHVHIHDLRFADYNPRAATKKEAQELKKSLERFGFVEPVLVNSAENRKNIIIGGHFRVRTAKELGIRKIPVHFVEITSEKKERELNLRLNKNLGHWDTNLLAEFDENLLMDVGFTEEEIGEIFTEVDSDDREDVVPDVPEEPTAQLGEMWKLGSHTIMCGDSTNADHVARLMGEARADMIFTDPPYNINYKGSGKNTSNTIKNDHMAKSSFTEFLNKVFAQYRAYIKNEGSMYVFHSTSTQAQFEDSITRSGFEVKNQLIWNKPAASLGWGDYRWKHEPFFYCTVRGKKQKFYGDRKFSTVWDFQKSERELLAWAKKMKRLEQSGQTTVWSMRRDNLNDYVHPTQKPVELIEYALQNNSKMGDTVMDLFLGSGSTLIAAEKKERVCFGMELDPKYIDVIIKRWEDFTGKKAEKIPPKS